MNRQSLLRSVLQATNEDSGYAPIKGVDYFDGKPGRDGREIELRKSYNAIQWRYFGDSFWTDLIDLSELRGRDGEDGKQHTTVTNYEARITVDGGRADSVYNINIPTIDGGGA